MSVENKHSSKKLVNDPRFCVEDSLHGYVLSHTGVKLHKEWNVVVRSDLKSLKKENKVVLITGGGSGHEPAHIGYIGHGMLTAAVCGGIFTSPTSSAVLHAIKTCSTEAGILLIVKNYTGDRLNFGKAAEMAKSLGIKVEMIVIGEDCALNQEGRSAGRRGLCGAILIHKIAGAMAECGKTLNEIYDIVKVAAINMGTMSISLSSCYIPGQPCNFFIADDTVEFGLGIHGEPGVSQLQMAEAAPLVERMIEHIMKSGYIKPLEAGCNIILIVNNLGGTSNLELSIVVKEAFQYLEHVGVHVMRCYSGTFVTSMEMAGVSMTIMHSNPELLTYLDCQTSAPSWPRCALVNQDIFASSWISEPVSETKEKIVPQGIGCVIFDCCKRVCNRLIANEVQLNSLDRDSGDGDTGTTLSLGARAILKKLLDHNLPVNNPKLFFSSLVEEIDKVVGGTSGALISILMCGISNSLNECPQQEEFSQAFHAGINVVKKYGGADIGDRTMLDVLCPVSSSIVQSISQDLNTKELFIRAKEAANTGAHSTTTMKARAGRASYVSNKRLTQPDPGAVAVAAVFEEIETYFSL